MLLPRSTPKEAWVDLIVCAALLVGCELLAGVIIHVLGRPHDPAAGVDETVLRKLLLPTLGLRALWSSAIIGALLYWRRQSLRSVGLTADAAMANVALGAATMIVSYALVLMVFPLLWLVWPALDRQMEENAERVMALIPKMTAPGFVLLSALVGTYEELLFRGFLMTRLRRATSSWTAAVVVSMAVFVALHAPDQTPAALVAVSVLGLVLSVVTVWRRSLIPAIVGHTLFDLGQLLYLSRQAGDAWA